MPLCCISVDCKDFFPLGSPGSFLLSDVLLSSCPVSEEVCVYYLLEAEILAGVWGGLEESAFIVCWDK